MITQHPVRIVILLIAIQILANLIGVFTPLPLALAQTPEAEEVSATTTPPETPTTEPTATVEPTVEPTATTPVEATPEPTPIPAEPSPTAVIPTPTGETTVDPVETPASSDEPAQVEEPTPAVEERQDDIDAAILNELLSNVVQPQVAAVDENPDGPAETETSDGKIDVFALSLVASNLGTDNPEADVNGDGTVDIFDLSLIANHYDQPFATLIPLLPDDQAEQQSESLDIPEPVTEALTPYEFESDEVSTSATYVSHPIKIFMRVDELRATACADYEGEYDGPLPRLGPWERCHSAADLKIKVDLNGKKYTYNARNDNNVMQIGYFTWVKNGYFAPNQSISLKIDAFDRDGRKCTKILVFKFNCRDREERMDLDPDPRDYDRRLRFNADACTVSGEHWRVLDRSVYYHWSNPDTRGRWCKIVIETEGYDNIFKTANPARMRYTLWGFRPS